MKQALPPDREVGLMHAHVHVHVGRCGQQNHVGAALQQKTRLPISLADRVAEAEGKIPHPIAVRVCSAPSSAPCTSPQSLVLLVD